MKYGVDMTFPPTILQAQKITELGWSFCGVYVGGPRAFGILKDPNRNPWKQIDGSRYPVRELQEVFNEFLPIYVGRNTGDDPNNPWDSFNVFTYEQGLKDGKEANILTGACGFGPTTPLCLDMEYGTYQAHPWASREYGRGWVESVNNAGHPAILYSDPYTIGAIGGRELWDYRWAAQWFSSVRGIQEAPIDRFNPSIPPPWDMWQFGGSLIAGVSVDVNSCMDDVELALYG